MPRTITVGLDGSPESRAAAEWAAREAQLRGLPVKLVQAWEAVPEPMARPPLPAAGTWRHGTGKVPRETADGLRLRHPGVEVTTEHVTGRPAEVLVRAAKDAELLVLGSRGLGGAGGFLPGSVGLAVVAYAERPVVLIRAGEQAGDEQEKDQAGTRSTAAAFRPVVLGLDAGRPDEEPLGFAFDAAARRNAPLRVVHGWNPPPYCLYGMALEPAVEREVVRGDAAIVTEVLRPWRQKFPDVEVVKESCYGSPSPVLIDASGEASLVVVGRRVRRSSAGARIGPVTHAVLHHATAPVAVVPHD
ncbi:universal stress protein [Streptomyces achromogenes]|uniref:universal stress protein n=1 Tax=Streptomyces achromogenes TaxID=67255 RepID=UPI003674DBC9